MYEAAVTIAEPVGVEAPALSVVVPCYNEEESLPELLGRLTQVCQATVGDRYEIVLIDDGSRDGTRQVMAATAAEDAHVVAVILSRNHGHQLALTAGLRVCRGDRILIIDADLQDPPELLGTMMGMMDEGADVVYGRRTERKGETKFKEFTASAFYRLLNSMIDIEIPRDTGDFRLMSRRALDQLNRMPEQHRFIRGMVSWIGFKQVPLDYVREPRFAGETKYPFRKMLNFAIDAISGFSTVPLRLSVYLGFVSAFFGFLLLLYTGYSYVAGIAVLGWTTIMVVVLILGSAQLMVLGVMGEYLGRLYIQSKNRPLFIIEEIMRQDPGEGPGEPRSGSDPT